MKAGRRRPVAGPKQRLPVLAIAAAVLPYRAVILQAPDLAAQRIGRIDRDVVELQRLQALVHEVQLVRYRRQQRHARHARAATGGRSAIDKYAVVAYDATI